MRALVLAGLLVTAVFLAGCTGTPEQRPCPTGEAREPVMIGTLLPTSGQLSELGTEVRAAVDVAVEQANLAGGVLGRQVSTQHVDSGGDPAVARAAARDLADRGVAGVVGPLTDAVAREALGPLLDAGVPVITPGVTGVGLPTPEEGFHRLVPEDRATGLALAQLLAGAGVDRVALLYANATYGDAVAGALDGALAQEDGPALVARLALPLGSDDHRQAVSQAGETDPDALVYVGFPEQGTRVLHAAHDQGLLEHVGVFLADGVMSQRFVDTVGTGRNATPILAGAQGVAPAALAGVTASQAFSERFQGIHGGPPGPFTVEAYDAALALILAAGLADASSPEAVAGCLSAVWNAPGEPVDTEDLGPALNAVADGRDVDLQGASGTADWAPDGTLASSVYVVWTVTDDGELRLTGDQLTVRP